MEAITTPEGNSIQFEGDRVSLTDMWRAYREPANLRPYDFLSLASTKQFVDYLKGELGLLGPDGPESTPQPEKAELYVTKSGPTGGTWGHWQLALAYARYLSPKFHAWSNTVIRKHFQPPAPAPTPVTPKTLITSTDLEALRLLTQHLDRMVGAGLLTNRTALLTMHEGWQRALGGEVPVIQEPQEVPPPSPESTPEPEPEPEPESEDLDPHEKKVVVEEGDYATTIPNLDKRGLLTGNEAAYIMRQAYGDVLSRRYPSRRKRSSERSTEGGLFLRLMRDLKLSPSRTKTYDPPEEAVADATRPGGGKYATVLLVPRVFAGGQQKTQQNTFFSRNALVYAAEHLGLDPNLLPVPPQS